MLDLADNWEEAVDEIIADAKCVTFRASKAKAVRQLPPETCPERISFGSRRNNVKSVVVSFESVVLFGHILEGLSVVLVCSASSAASTSITSTATATASVLVVAATRHIRYWCIGVGGAMKTK